MKLANTCTKCHKRIFVTSDVPYVTVGDGRAAHVKCERRYEAGVK